MNSPHQPPASNRSFKLGISLTILGLGLIFGALWFAFGRPASNEELVIESSAPSPIADVTPLPELEELLAEDNNVVQVSSNGFIYPINLRISEISLDIPVSIVGLNDKNLVTLPTDTAGFWDASTTLSANGNTVLVGHNKLTPQKVFWEIDQATTGMEVQLTSQFGKEYTYTIEEVEIIQVEGAQESEFQRIAELMKLEDGTERLTIVSCFPAGSCASRIVLIAKPS